MGDKTEIEWTDATWNPVRGCRRVSEGCRNCYAERVAARFSGPGLPYEGLVTDKGRWNGVFGFVADKLDQPLRWSRSRRIFVNSMSDLFGEGLANEEIAAVFGVMAASPHHTFQILTKRPERMVEWFRWVEKRDTLGGVVDDCQAFAAAWSQHKGLRRLTGPTWPLPNVWLGVSVEDQAAADERIPLLLQTPSRVRWISAEPLLGPVTLNYLHYNGEVEIDALNGTHGIIRPHGGENARLDWVVVGGESGPNARPMHPDWVRDLRDQCVAAGVPFHFKQWGRWSATRRREDMTRESRTFRYRGVFAEVTEAIDPVQGDILMTPLGKKKTGRLLDGRTWDEWPDLR